MDDLSNLEHKSTEKKRNYCCICSNFRGKLVDGKQVRLHRFPADEKVRKLWIKRLKTVSTGFVLKIKNDRLCSAHFVDGVYNSKNQIPSIFMVNNKQKIFKTSEVEEESYTTEASAILQENEDSRESDCYENTSLNSCFVPEHVSVQMHDYITSSVKETCTVTQTLPKLIQTDWIMCDMATQTDLSLSLFQKLTCDTSSQTDMNNCSIEKDIGIQCNKPELVAEDIVSDDMCMFYTGLPNKEVFNAIFSELDDAEERTNRSGNGENKGRPRTLRLVDEFLLVLMRLRLGLLLEDLAYRFRISKATCSNINKQWIMYLSVKLASMIPWISRRFIRENMPAKFKKYPHCRVIIDCTEFYTQNPQSLAAKTLLYSHYKSHMTWKALIGISPTGVITFVSDLWSGGISDKQITIKSGLLELCEAGDAVMADKGFLISDLTTPRGLHLIIPPMKFQRFNRRQVEETRRIANLRIDVERAMERLKNFRILQGVMPITMSKQASHILKICAALSNVHPPLIQDN
ncbi:uncharacterized protein LOC127850537 isoform X2 [Dreissena polymorpha]|uniref:uncharacterized protein LOC127850537 isoform X2 n=1 Tax=Dreissena polymorpha TaxID=45954 RepID=UPI0022640446|nr:uncharacterized protein LOC127850537 isoform X2 [Dreissena polymorpha]